MLSAAALTNVYSLNLGYDVNVKQYSLHLLILAGFLLGPDLRALADFLILHRPARLSPSNALFRSHRLNRAALILQLVYGGYAITRQCIDVQRQARHSEAMTRNIPFAGIWTVDEFWVNAEMRLPLTTDDNRWWRVILEPDPFNANPDVILEMASGARRFFYAEFDNGSTLVKLKPIDDDRMWFPERFRGQPPTPVAANLRLKTSTLGRLTLDGDFEGQHVRASLHRTEKRFLLLERGFHWINDRPFWTR